MRWWKQQQHQHAYPIANVSGAASKGLLLNAPVTFYAVANGTAGATAIGSTRTDAQKGTFSSTVSSSGPVVVTVNVDNLDTDAR